MMKRMSGMKIKLPHVDRFKDRHGRVRLYYRNKTAGTPRVLLRGPEGSPEFLEDYQAAASGAVTNSKRKKLSKSSFRWLVEQYYSSADFKTLALNTQKTRRRILDKFCEENGEKRFEMLERKHLLKIRDGMLDRPEAANNLMKAIKRVYFIGNQYGHCEQNPAEKIGKLKSKNPDGFHTWTLDEIEQFKSRHPIGTKARLALSLLLFTGQRRSDVVKMGRQHIQDDFLSVRQQKTGKKLSIPIIPALRAVLDASAVGELTFLVTQHGLAYTANGFGNWFRTVCDEAGLKHCSSHGLRKAAATALAESGCSDHEIKAITGHSRSEQVAVYTEKVNQKKLAASAMRRLTE